MDRLVQSQSKFVTLIDVVERQAGSVLSTKWWGPVIGSDETLPDDTLNPGPFLEKNVLEDEKITPLAVCED